MKRIKWTVALVALGITVASLSLWSNDNRKHLPVSVCDLAGAWVGSSPAIPGFASVPILSTKSVTATDPSGHRFTAVIQPVNVGNAIAFGPFPDADHFSEGVGTYVRSGRRTYQFTWVDYFWKSPPAGPPDRGQVLYFWTYSGTLEFVDANTTKLSGNLSFYSNVDRPGVHDQDQDDDGFADEGEEPFVCLGPWEWTYKRVPVMEPCPPQAP